MNIDDTKLNSIIHEITKIITALKKKGLSNLALKMEGVREKILFAIEEDIGEKNDN